MAVKQAQSYNVESSIEVPDGQMQSKISELESNKATITGIVSDGKGKVLIKYHTPVPGSTQEILE